MQSSTGPENGPAVVQKYVYDGDQIILALDGSDTPLARYLWGPATDLLLAEDHLGASPQQFWPLGDHQNSVRDLVERDPQSGSAEIVDHVIYSALGEVAHDSEEEIGSLFGFTGRPSDPSTNLQNNLHRWYDAALTQWLSEDPIGFSAGDANTRRYVSNDPINKVDPSGLEEVYVQAEVADDGKLKFNVYYEDEATYTAAWMTLGLAYITDKRDPKKIGELIQSGQHAGRVDLGNGRFATMEAIRRVSDDGGEYSWWNPVPSTSVSDAEWAAFKKGNDSVPFDFSAKGLPTNPNLRDALIGTRLDRERLQLLAGKDGAGLPIAETMPDVSRTLEALHEIRALSDQAMWFYATATLEVGGAKFLDALSRADDIHWTDKALDQAQQRTKKFDPRAIARALTGVDGKSFAPGRIMLDLEVPRQQGHTCVSTCVEILFPDRAQVFAAHRMTMKGLKPHDALAFIDDNLRAAHLATRRGSVEDGIKSGKSFIAFVDGGTHAVVVDGVEMIDNIKYVTIRDPAIGAYCERYDWFVQNRAIASPKHYTHPAVWGVQK